MKKVIGLALSLVVAGGCHRARMSPPVPGVPGGANARDAITGFIGAAKAGDLQGMSLYFGTAEGPSRETIPQDELEKRFIYQRPCLRNDRFTILSDGNGQQGMRIAQVQLVRGDLTRNADFTTVQGKNGRWFVYSFAIEKLTDICTAK